MEGRGMSGILLRGLDGSNPLGFLTAIGALSVSSRIADRPKLTWEPYNAQWRPRILGCGEYVETWITALHRELANSRPFDAHKRLPFTTELFRDLLQKELYCATPDNRRIIDILAGLGSDAFSDKKGEFCDTALRMVRRGDSVGQGLLAYAVAIRQNTEPHNLNRALFSEWDYQDDAFSLRWDPIDDQRYALRWDDPSLQANKKHSLRTMIGAQALALEALGLFPVLPTVNTVRTTGFCILGKRKEFLTWPIWDAPATIDVVRSILALRELQQALPVRHRLSSMGIKEVFRCERIASSKYYKNFSTSTPA